MKPMHDLSKHNALLRYLNQIPRKMVALHGRDNVAAFVLYDLCHENGFNLVRAAYLVDNPDFNCLKGVAGIHRDEKHIHGNGTDFWQDPDLYTKLAADSLFNRRTREIEQESIERNGSQEKKAIAALAHQLDFKNPEYYSWKMRHDNKGFFIFDRVNGELKELDEHMNDCIHFFSYCPIA
jgi:hypothetical protein